MISVELLRAAEASGAEQCWPVDSGCFLLQLLPGPDLGAVLKVLALVDRLASPRAIGLKPHGPPSRTLSMGSPWILAGGFTLGFVLVLLVGLLRLRGQERFV